MNPELQAHEHIAPFYVTDCSPCHTPRIADPCTLRRTPSPRQSTRARRLTASAWTCSTPCAGSRSAGIFLLNLASFSGFAFMTPEMMAASPTAAVDLPVAGLTVWLGYGKFYSLFSLLFGIGFSLQLAAAGPPRRRAAARLPAAPARAPRDRRRAPLLLGRRHPRPLRPRRFLSDPLPARLGPDAAAHRGRAHLRAGAARGAHRRHAWRARSRSAARCAPATPCSSPRAFRRARCPIPCCAMPAGPSISASS